MRRLLGFKTIIIITLLILLGVSFSACSKENQLLFNEDTVVGRFADGMDIVSYSAAPKDAREYFDMQRVVKKIYVNNNVKGLHLTGLYLPAGESLSIEIPMEVTQVGAKIYINANTAQEEIHDLSNKKTVIQSNVGGIVDFLFEGNGTITDYFTITIGGCIESPYYRYGVDSKKKDGYLQSFSKEENLLVALDCGNIRFYATNKIVSQIEDLYNTMKWWRSIIEMLNEAVELSFEDGYTAPMIVYLNNGIDSLDRNVINCDEQNGNNLFDYNSLLKGTAYPLLQKIANQKVQKSAIVSGESHLANYGEIISILSINNMIDNNLVTNDRLKLYGNSYDSLDFIIKNDLSEEEKSLAFFINLSHYFEIKHAVSIIKKFKINSDVFGDQAFIDKFYTVTSEILNYDLREYIKIFGYEVSSDLLSKNDKPIFVPVQTEYTLNNNVNTMQMGTIVDYGVATKFDFMKEIVSPKTGWEFVSLEGSSGSWHELEKGVYNYTPDSKRLTDEFRITLKNDEYTTILLGKIAVNINVVEYKQYNNVSYRDVDKAINDIDKLSSDYSDSLSKAINMQVSDNVEGGNNYAFSTTKGSLQVKESGTYTFYLKNTGLCRVDFGVDDYYFKMFYNYLTVQQYTDELSYEAKLEAGKVYHFSIYVLAITGTGKATLGIKRETKTDSDKSKEQSIVDIGEDYLIYNGFDRGNMVYFQPPTIPINGYEKENSIINYKNTVNWKISGNSEQASDSKYSYLTDKDKSTVYKSAKSGQRHDIEIDFGQSTGFEYLEVNIPNTSINKGDPIRLKVFISDDGKTYNQIEELVLEKALNSFNLDAISKHVKLSFERNEDFVLEVSDIGIGDIFAQSIIVPNTSSKIEYRGLWVREEKFLSVNGSVNVSKEKNCTAKFEFYGNAFALYATKSEQFGKAKLYVDDQVYGIDFTSKDTMCGQRIFSWNFKESGYHTIKIVPEKNNAINIDYITYIPDQAPERQPPSNSNIAMIIVIPSIVIIVGLVCIIADIAVKVRRKKNA